MNIKLTGPYTIVHHANHWWVKDGGFRICALVDIGYPEEYAQAIADELNYAHEMRQKESEMKNGPTPPSLNSQ